MGATSTRRTPRKSPPAAKKSRSPSPSPAKRKSRAKSASPSPSPKKKATPVKKAAKPSLEPISHLGCTIDAGQIQALRDYQYNSLNRSILCNSPLADVWEFFAAILPMWVTPNMVTVLGACCSWSVLAFCQAARVASIAGEDETWYLAVGGFMVIAYNTLDNMDGKLARGRGMGSPLGQRKHIHATIHNLITRDVS